MSFLTDAAAIVNASGKWCKGANARTASGKWCSPLSPNAVAWDVYGALIKAKANNAAYHVSDFDAAYAHLKAKIPVVHTGAGALKNNDIEHYNDTLAFGSIAGLFT
jgi:hypothetical protein